MSSLGNGQPGDDGGIQHSLDYLFSKDGVRMRGGFLRGLRSARASVLANAEGFESLVREFERIGRYFVPSMTGFAEATEPLAVLMMVPETGFDSGALAVQREQCRRRLFLVRQSRNDAVHQGSHARDTAALAVRVALDLEEALMTSWNDIRLSDIMTRGVQSVHSDETLNTARQMMLEFGITHVPVHIDGDWFLLSDHWVASELLAKSNRQRKQLLQQQLGQVFADQPKCLVKAELYAGSCTLSDFVAMSSGAVSKGLVLVGEPGTDHLSGVVAPSDLL